MPRCGARMIVIEVFAARLRAELAADTEQDRHFMSQTFLSTLRLSRSDALAPRRRRSLSTQSHPPVRRSPVNALRAGRRMPTALSPPRLRADIEVRRAVRAAHHRDRRQH